MTMQKKKSLATKDKEKTAPSKLIDKRIKELGDWRGDTLSRVRALIHEADPDVVEEWKWRGVPVFEHDGILCTGETYKEVVKLTFAKGAALKDPAKLFNSSLEGNVRRAIDIREGEKINEKALKALIRAAVDLNASKKRKLHAKKIPLPARAERGIEFRSFRDGYCFVTLNTTPSPFAPSPDVPYSFFLYATTPSEYPPPSVPVNVCSTLS